MRLTDDAVAEELTEEVELRVARRRGPPRDLVDGAVVLAQPERAVGVDERLGEVAGLVLEDRQRLDAVGEAASSGNRSAMRRRMRSPICRRRAAKTCSTRSSPPTASMALTRPDANPP